MMPLHANFPLKIDHRLSIATGWYHVSLENLPLTLKLPLVVAVAPCQIVQGIACVGELRDCTVQIGLHVCWKRVRGGVPRRDLIQQPVGVAALGVNLEESVA